MQPAAKGNAIRLIENAAGIGFVELGKNGAPQKIRVESRDAVDSPGANKSQMAHAHAPLAVFGDER